MKKRTKNFKIFEGFSFYTPGFGEIGILLLLLIAGTFAGSFLTILLSTLYSSKEVATEFSMVLSYPVMFLPAMVYASIRSKRNSFFDTGYKLDSSHFGKTGMVGCALLAFLAAYGVSFISDFFSSMLPDIPEILEEILSSLTSGNIWIDILCVSIFAPFFEEWLCRGMVLRGLLNYKRENGSRGIKPAWAIILSALFFAVLHANPWQAIPAFAIGCVMGYVYYKTGSLKLTMFIHFMNNTLAVILTRIEGLEDMMYWTDVLKGRQYWVIFSACVLLAILVFRVFQRIPLRSPQGNCDEIDIDSII